VEVVVAEQPVNPELLEDPGLRPLLEAPMGRGMIADARGIQSTPLDARARHKKDRVHGGAIIHTRVVAAQGVRLARRQKLLHLLPELVRDAPAVDFGHKAHKKCSPFLAKTFPSPPAFQAQLR